MKAIVYTSASGFTKKYAEMLREKIGISIYTIEDAKQKLKKGDEIVYMGWMFAGSVKSYKKAARLYNVKAVCAIGMAPSGQNALDEIRQHEAIPSETPIFYLQGGYAPQRLHGIYKIMMSAMSKSVIRKIEAKPERTVEDEEMLKVFREGCDYVSEENAKAVLDWLSENA